MDPNDKQTDRELVGAAEAGLRGQGAAVEMMRRLRDSNTRLTIVNLFLTAAAVFVGVVQIVVTRCSAH